MDPVLFCREALLFDPDPWQARLLTSRARRIIVNVARQSGKSTTAAAIATHQSLFFPRSLSLIVAPAVPQAGELRRKVDDHLDAMRVKVETIETNKRTLEFANKSRIIIVAADEDTVRAYSPDLIVEDESSVVKDDVFEAMEPMLLVTGGRHLLLSTPAGLKGHFADIWHHAPDWDGASGWEKYRVTAWDNPRARGLENLRAEKERMGRLWWFQQEYECSFIAAAQGLVYPYEPSKNAGKPMEHPARELWQYVLGIDYGFTDATAYVVLGWRRDDPNLYVIETKEKTGLLASEAAAIAKDFTERYPFARIVGDISMRGYVEEARRRFSLPIEAAEKHNKRGYIDLMASDLRAGLLKVLPGNEALVSEWQSIPWDESRELPKDGYKDHLCLAEGTLIATPTGDVPIESIAIGDMVMTRNGSRPVSAVRMTGARDTMVLETLRGRRLEGTENHAIVVDGSMVRLDALSYGDSLTACESTSSGFSARGTRGIRTPSGESFVSTSSRKGEGAFTGRNGSTSEAPSPTGTSSTTKTATLSTIGSRISRASTTARIMPVISPRSALPLPLPGSRTFVTWLLPGTGHRRGALGTLSTQRIPGVGAFRSGVSASYAAAPSRPFKVVQASVPARVTPSGVATRGRTTSFSFAASAARVSWRAASPSVFTVRDSVLRVATSGERKRVWNLTVEGEHEYFANGILVGNSDACLYAWRAAMHFVEEVRKAKPKPGTREAYEAEADSILEARIKAVTPQERAWWDAQGDAAWQEEPQADWVN